MNGDSSLEAASAALDEATATANVYREAVHSLAGTMRTCFDAMTRRQEIFGQCLRLLRSPDYSCEQEAAAANALAEETERLSGEVARYHELLARRDEARRRLDGAEADVAAASQALKPFKEAAEAAARAKDEEARRKADQAAKKAARRAAEAEQQRLAGRSEARREADGFAEVVWGDAACVSASFQDAKLKLAGVSAAS